MKKIILTIMIFASTSMFGAEDNTAKYTKACDCEIAAGCEAYAILNTKGF